MKSLIIGSLIFASSGAMALTCTSEQHVAVSFNLTDKGGGLAQGYYSSPEIKTVYAAKVEDTWLQTNYKLVDQEGEVSTFSLKKHLIFADFCRARVCPPTPTHPTLVGKLTHPSGEDEYFKCL